MEGVRLRYGRGPEILKDANMALAPGSIHFLRGESGAGKTSVIRLLSLDLKPSRGLIKIFGEDVSNLSRDRTVSVRRRIGVVYQDFALLPHLDVFDNVCLPMRVRREVPVEVYERDALDLIEWAQLGHRVRALPPTLSGGEKQRVAIARAVIAKPELLLADEPTGNVDPARAQMIMNLFHKLNTRWKTTVLVATHDPALNRNIGAPELRLEDGAILSERDDYR
jgi:cell division transport system ATP-binding protein